MAIFRSEAEEPICTLQNMTPDHIRILDGRFKAPRANDLRHDADSEKRRAVNAGRKVEVWDDYIKHVFENYQEAADFCGIQWGSVSYICKHGYKAKKRWRMRYLD